MYSDFTYYTPTKVVFGKNSDKQLGSLVREQGAKKVLIHYGGSSAVKSGLLQRVEDTLKEADVEYVKLGGVVPNPHLSLVYEGIRLCKKENVDFVLAVGGGSVIDSAKAIGYGVANEGDVWDFYEHTRTANACLPIGAVLTIAAAGSEMSDSCVITNEKTGSKRGYSSNYARCRFAVMNPEFTKTLPEYQTMSGATDILMHTMERYFNRSGNMDLTDAISEGLMRTVLKHTRVLLHDPDNYEARAELMWAGSLSHNGLTGCGVEKTDFATHKLEHELGGMFDVTHGAGLAALWGTWARYVWHGAPHRFEKFAVNVMGVEPQPETGDTIESGIRAMEDFYREIHMPTSLKELGIEPTDEQIEEMAKCCIAACGGPAGAVVPLYKEDIINIYRQARGAID